MSSPEEKEVIRAEKKAAFKAALAARKKTFMAFYPRKLKVGLLLFFFACLLIIFWPTRWTPSLPEPSPHAEKEVETAQQEKTKEETPEAEEKLAAESTGEKLESCVEPEEGEDKAKEASRLVFSQAQKDAIARNDKDASMTHLNPAPDPELVLRTSGGYLPKIGTDGRKPWMVYARPFDRLDPRPRIAIIIGDLGLSRVATDATMRRLPPAVTLAFDAQSDNVDAWLRRARQDGHETLLTIPMEPLDFPKSDPGPDTLLTSLPNSDNLDRLHGFLEKGTGYVGVTTLTGSRFAADTEKLMPIMQTLYSRGLLVLDAHISHRTVIQDLAKQMKIPLAISSYTIDQNPEPRAIDDVLAHIEKAARQDGSVVAMASPLPVTLERIGLWAKELQKKGFVLVPVSAVVQ